MPTNRIEINSFRYGVFTNADQADIPKEAFLALENMEIRAGKTVKTFAFGDKSLTAFSTLPDSFGTFINDNLTNDYIYFAVWVNSSTKIVTIQYWNAVQSAWKDIDDATYPILVSGESLPTVYHKAAQNPIIYHNNELRILPGNVGKADTTNQSKGVWIGYVDRDYFDENYDPTAGFYAYTNIIEAPDTSTLALVIDQLGGSAFNPDTTDDLELAKYYKMTSVYDGIQESLMTDPIGIYFREQKFMYGSITITKADHNKRVTAYKLYRADSEDGVYYHILTINLLRKSGNTLVADSNSAYDGLSHIYVPGLTDYTFDITKYYALYIYNIAEDAPIYRELKFGTYTGTGNVVFEVSASHVHGLDATWDDYIAGDYWNVRWALFLWDGAAWGIVSAQTATSGCFCGYRTIVFPTNTFLEGELGGNVFYIGVGAGASQNYFEIIANTVKAVRIGLGSTFTSSWSSAVWEIMRVSKGLYRVANTTLSVTITFFDTGLTAGATFALQNEVSINVNGRFAKMIGQRLIQINNVLDPGGEDQETHDDWGSYSEFNQPDVNPVSNVLRIIDREGGPCMGVVESLGGMIVLKKKSMIRIKFSTNTPDSFEWTQVESNFDRGCIAPFGIVEDGSTVYFPSDDGIYKINLNVAAASDSTPIEANRISEPINDFYESVADHTDVIGIFDQYKNEVILFFVLPYEQYIWASDGDTTDLDDRITDSAGDLITIADTTGSYLWAYNISTGEWRQIGSNNWPYLWALDENGDILLLSENDKTIYSSKISEAVGMKQRTKWFHISDERDDVCRNAYVTYKSVTPLTVNLYINDNDTKVVKTGTLPASSAVTTKIISFKYRCNRFMIELIDTAKSTTSTEIHKMRMEHDF